MFIVFFESVQFRNKDECLNYEHGMKFREKIVKLIFKHTTTIGIRETLCHRYILDRKEDIISTDNGNVRVKTSFGYGTVRHKYEYNDLKFIAKKTGLSIQELIEKLDS